MKVIWYDVTEIFEWKGHHTGIQRVIYMLGSKLAQDPNFEVKYCRFDREVKRYTQINYEFLEHKYAPAVKKIVPKKPSLLVRIRIFSLGFIPQVFKSLAWSSIKLTVRTLHRVKPIHFKKDDTLFIPGAFWTGFVPTLLAIKKQNPSLRVIGIMYDLVPLVKSQYSPEGTVKDYRRYITRALKVYDSWLSISENTKVDLLGYAKEHKVVLKSDKVSTIRLGSDIDIDGQTKPLLVNRQTPKDFILSVGTLEPRKNQLLIYQAVKLSIERGIDLPLVIIAGKRGWLSEDLAYMLKNDQTIKGKLLWREEVDDRSLRWLYKNCLFTVYPSNYEGWGLPIAESLAYGKTCISTRTSSIPEIAGDRIRYFSPNSPDELLELLRTYSTNKGLLAKATEEAVSFKQTKWDETYAQVVEHIGY